MKKFNLGQVVVTRGVNDYLADNRNFTKFVIESLTKYQDCDWGQTDEEDKPLNDEAVEIGERIVAFYEKEGLPKILIITEWDRSVTTILFPHEY